MQEIKDMINIINKKCEQITKNYEQKCVKDTKKQVFNVLDYQSKMTEQLINTIYKK
jgi:hypothetical protein